MKNGLYSNIHKKRKRIAEGSGEKMNKAGKRFIATTNKARLWARSL